MEKSKVYFTKELTPESIVRIYEALGRNLKGRERESKLYKTRNGKRNSGSC